MAELTLTKNNFEAEVMQSRLPVLIDFWASWCGPCRMLAPVIEQIAEETAGSVKVGKANVDEEPELAAAFQVSSIPTLVVIRDGKITQTAVGVQPKDRILDMLR